jgi:hypothetical protein
MPEIINLSSRNMVELPKNSMFVKTPIYQLSEEGEDIFEWGLWAQPLVAANSDTLHEVTQLDQNRLDRISSQYYGVPDLWWAIAAVNNIVDVHIGSPAGTTLRIPSRSRLINLGILKD